MAICRELARPEDDFRTLAFLKADETVFPGDSLTVK